MQKEHVQSAMDCIAVQESCAKHKKTSRHDIAKVRQVFQSLLLEWRQQLPGVKTPLLFAKTLNALA